MKTVARLCLLIVMIGSAAVPSLAGPRRGRSQVFVDSEVFTTEAIRPMARPRFSMHEKENERDFSRASPNAAAAGAKESKEGRTSNGARPLVSKTLSVFDDNKQPRVSVQAIAGKVNGAQLSLTF